MFFFLFIVNLFNYFQIKKELIALKLLIVFYFESRKSGLQVFFFMPSARRGVQFILKLHSRI